MSDCCNCGSTVELAAMQARQRRVLLIVMLINIGSCAMMFAAAYLSHSSALLSGTLDNLGDDAVSAGVAGDYEVQDRKATELLAMVGARLADGCPSGHGLSGLMQLSISGFVALALFVGTGILVALLVYGGKPHD